MRTLIDGYNLMFALGLLGRRSGPGGLRKVRHRFLNDLASKLEPIEAHQTTVVFDAAAAPDLAPGQARHKGLTIVFAVNDESADARLEHLIARDSAPKSLTVVSSDNRIRRAGSRRRAHILTSEEYWSRLEDRRRRQPAPPATAEDQARQQGLSAAESAYWLDAFRDVIADPEARAGLAPADFIPTDEEIRRIEREVEEEP